MLKYASDTIVFNTIQLIDWAVEQLQISLPNNPFN